MAKKKVEEDYITKREAIMMDIGKMTKLMDKVWYYYINKGVLYYASGRPAYDGEWVDDKFQG